MLAFLQQKLTTLVGLVKKLLPRRKYFFITSAFFVPAFILFFFVGPDIAFAGLASDLVTGMLNLIGWVLFSIAELGKNIAIYMLQLFLELARYHDFVDMEIVTLGWSMIRDVANMFFIVMLLVIAFATILGVDSYEMKSTLPRLLLMAILINFSKLICGVILDAAHVFTITFVNAISATAGGNFVNAFHLADLWTKISEEQSETVTQTAIQLDTFLAGVMAVFMVGTAVLAMGAYAIVMLYRIVVLWILIILSPIAYVAAVLPKTKSFANEWWSKFIQQTMVAPVMVFFIWLFFATLGQGNIQDQMGVMDGDLGKQESVTKNKATNWSHLSGFFVAAAFLFGGLQQIGQKFSNVEGIDWVQGAQQKSKSLMYNASGARTARWAGGKAKEGAKEHTPLVGAKHWRRRGKVLKSYASIAGDKMGEAQDSMGEFLEGKVRNKFGKRSKTSRAINAGIGMVPLFKSNMRADEEAETWEKAAKHYKNKRREDMSTSKTTAGIKKRKYRAQEQAVEKRNEGKGRRKAAQDTERLLSGEYGDEYKGMMETAEEEGIKAEEIERRNEVAQARLRDKELREKNRHAEANNEDYVLSQQQEELMEKRAVADFDYAMNLTDNQFERVIDALQSLGEDGLSEDEIGSNLRQLKQVEQRGGDPAEEMDLSENTIEKLKDLRTARANLGRQHSGNYGQGAAFGTSGEGRILSKIGDSGGYTMDVNQDNLNKMHADYLSSRLGRKVSASEEGVNEAWGEFQASFDNEKEFNAFMEADMKRMNDASTDGSAALGGLFRREIKKDGSKTIRRTSKEKDKNYIENMRKKAIAASTPGQTSGFDKSLDRNEKGQVAIESEAALDNMVNILSRLDRNKVGNLNEYDYDTITKALSNAEIDGGAEKVIKKLGEQMEDDQGMAKLLSRTAKKLENLKKAESSKEESKRDVDIDSIESAIKDVSRHLEKIENGGSKEDDGDFLWPPESADDL